MSKYSVLHDTTDNFGSLLQCIREYLFYKILGRVRTSNTVWLTSRISIIRSLNPECQLFHHRHKISEFFLYLLNIWKAPPCKLFTCSYSTSCSIAPAAIFCTGKRFFIKPYFFPVKSTSHVYKFVIRSADLPSVSYISIKKGLEIPESTCTCTCQSTELHVGYTHNTCRMVCICMYVCMYMYMYIV